MTSRYLLTVMISIFFSPASRLAAILLHLSSTIHHVPDPNLNRFYFNHITLDDFLKAFYKSKSKSIDFDRIFWQTLEISLPASLPHILNIFNNSLNSMEFPDSWKKFLITPLPKIKNPSSVSDFRPISLLPILSKVFEKIIHTKLTSYLHDNALLNVHQAEFTKSHSTQTLLLKVIDDDFHDPTKGLTIEK